MKVFVFMLFIAIAVAFPSGESETAAQPELQTEQMKEEQNALLAAEGNPKGDNEESEAERAKRTIIFGYGWPYAYSYPFYAPVVHRSKVIFI